MNTNSDEQEGPRYTFDNSERYFDNAEALSKLLAEEGLIFLAGEYGPFWEPGDGVETSDRPVSLYVNCNDQFYWGCADSEPLPIQEIEPLYDEWMADPKWGSIKWACKRRKLRPQVPIVKDMKKEGKWTAELEALPAPKPS